MLFIGVFPVSGDCETIVLKDGTKIEDIVTGYDADTVQLKSRGAIKISDVKEIFFSSKIRETDENDAVVDEAEIKAIIASADGFEKKISDQSGLILLDDGYYEYRPDGTTLYRYHYRFKVLKDNKKRKANVTHYFNEGRERVNVKLARTISPAGKVYYMKPDAINISKPTGSSTSFSRYSTFSFMLPNVEVGSIMEYVIEVEEYNPFEKRFFFPRFGFQADMPILLSRLTVAIPEDKQLYYVFNNFDDEHKEPKVENANGMKSYEWSYHESEPMIREPAMPAFKDVAPYVACSLFEEWDLFLEWSKGLIEKNIEVTPSIKKKVAELTKNCKSDEERIAKIYHYIQRKIRYISIKSSIGSGYSGHPASDTLKNEYGDCIDKATLFTSMLKVLDITSYPVILKTNNSNVMERRLPGFDTNHAITKIILADRVMFLDTTSQNFRYPYFSSGDHGVWVINALQKKFEYIETPKPEDNATILVAIGKIYASGDLEIDNSESYTGTAEARQRYYTRHLKPSNIKRYLVNNLNSISPGSRLKYLAITDNEDYEIPITFDTGYILKEYAISAGDLVIFGIPDIERTFGAISLKKRKYPLEFSTSKQSKISYTIDLQGNFKVKYLPEPLSIDSEFFSYDMEYKEEGGKIIFTEDYKRKKRIVPLEAYDRYRDEHKRIERRLKEKIFLTRVK